MNHNPEFQQRHFKLSLFVSNQCLIFNLPLSTLPVKGAHQELPLGALLETGQLTFMKPRLVL
jgi:hypothetical protein